MVMQHHVMTMNVRKVPYYSLLSCSLCRCRHVKVVQGMCTWGLKLLTSPSDVMCRTSFGETLKHDRHKKTACVDVDDHAQARSVSTEVAEPAAGQTCEQAWRPVVVRLMFMSRAAQLSNVLADRPSRSLSCSSSHCSMWFSTRTSRTLCLQHRHVQSACGVGRCRLVLDMTPGHRRLQVVRTQ